MQNSKPWYQSKIVWLNALATIAAVLDALKVLNLSPEIIAYGAALVAAGNVILRIWFTSQPIMAQPSEK